MVVVLLRRVVELRIPAEEDIQSLVVRIRMEAVHLAVDTEPVVDAVIVAGIVVVPEVDMMSVLEQDMESELHLVGGMGLMQVQVQEHKQEQDMERELPFLGDMELMLQMQVQKQEQEQGMEVHLLGDMGLMLQMQVHEQEQEQGIQWLLHHRWDMELIQEQDVERV